MTRPGDPCPCVSGLFAWLPATPKPLGIDLTRPPTEPRKRKPWSSGVMALPIPIAWGTREITPSEVVVVDVAVTVEEPDGS